MLEIEKRWGVDVIDGAREGGRDELRDPPPPPIPIPPLPESPSIGDAGRIEAKGGVNSVDAATETATACDDDPFGRKGELAVER